jgi:cytidyltransferase-like protein
MNKLRELLGEDVGTLIADKILGEVSASGVTLITLQIKKKDNEYWKGFNRDIDEKYSKTCYIKSGNKKDNFLEKYQEFWKDFYDDLYDCEWTNETVNEMSARRHGCIRKNGIVYLKDVKSSRYNVINGERMTVGQPLEYERTIYFYGQCLTTGWYVEDSKTIESYLQAIVNEKGYRAICVNYGSFQDELSLLLKICSTEYKKGDIVVIFDNNKSFDGILNINLADSLERESVPAKWVVDAPKHCNHKVNEIYAKEIFDFIENKLDEKPEGTTADKVEIPKDNLVRAYIDMYFHDYKPVGSVGSIVMNCNPFTLGHRHLIEQALTMVDNLIIFVVEEDKSLFSFRERYEMVQEGTKDLANIKIAPSGDFILSQNTFPEYFLKIEDKDIVNNVENDITLFAEGVAPRLNITYRFVGEEKADRVTDTYNEAMKRILPAHGIEIIEIPRKTMADGEAISATRVRERLETYPFGDLSDLLLDSTQRLLVQSW